MTVRQIADDVALEVITSLGGNADKTEDVSRIVEKALLSVMRDTQSGCVDVVNVCCSADQDLAHKISDEIQKKKIALIANLSSLR